MSERSGNHIDVDEVLPPERGRPRAAGDPRVRSETSRILAYWLDEFIRIPGTKVRIGLDPILAMIPFVGDFLASGAGFAILVEAARNGVPIPVLARMGLNMLFNTALDVVPGIGPVASIFFKSNSRNLQLLHRWQAGQHTAVKRGTWAVFAFVAFLGLLILSLCVAVLVFLLSSISKPFQ